MRARNVLVSLLAVTAILTAACAKRPAMTQASAPPPIGAVSALAAPTQAPTQALSPAPSGVVTGIKEPSPPPSREAAQEESAPNVAPRDPATATVPQPEAVQPSAAPRGETSTAAPAPAAALPAPKEFTAAADLQDVHFDFDKYAIRPGDAKILDRNAEWLKSNPQTLLLIEGHCDERGTNEYNVALGERRAKSTQIYLVSRGVQSDRISIISYGEERPACSGLTEECWAKNRRAHFLVKER